MSKEDKQFFDGLLLGAILIGIVLSVFILYAFYRNPQPLVDLSVQEVSEDLFQPQEQEQQNQDNDQEPIPEQINRNEEITNLIFKDDLYLVLTEKLHPTDDLTYRLLARDTEANRATLEQFRAATDLDLNELNYCLDNLNGFENPILTVWDKNGERLSIFEDNLREAFPDTICPTVERWYEDSLVIRFAYGDAGLANNTIYTYSLDGSINKVIDSVTSYLFIEDAYIAAWTNGETTFAQKNTEDTHSNIVNATDQNIFDLTDISELPVVYETDQLAQVDVASDYNLRNHTGGLEYVIGGERVVIPWNKK